MRYNWYTIWFIILLILIIGIYDIYAYFNWGQSATISLHLQEYSKEMPAVPFAIGFIMGHLFWQNRKAK